MVEFLDQLKKLSFDYATYSGISISPFELEGIVVKEKPVAQAEEKVKQIDNYCLEGYYDEVKAQQEKIVIWEECKDELQKQLVNNLAKRSSTSFYHIWDSGARASSENLTQLFAMRGHATNYLGEVIEMPIVSSLWEGLSPFEFFISVYGAVKGMIDIALKTAQAGDLTRRLVESSQRLTITTSDCQTTLGILLEDNDMLPLGERIYGRYLVQDIFNQEKEVILARNTLLLEAELKKIAENKISAVWVRSPLNCELVERICQKCYGLDLS
jgi:DNA-directed RNA polymerase subunit beta'